MLNDIKVPPSEPPADNAHLPKSPVLRSIGVKPHEPLTPTIDTKGPGLHHARSMGEPTKIDPIYAMPMEDRGSFFSLILSAVVVGVFCILLIIVWLTMFK